MESCPDRLILTQDQEEQKLDPQQINQLFKGEINQETNKMPSLFEDKRDPDQDSPDISPDSRSPQSKEESRGGFSTFKNSLFEKNSKSKLGRGKEQYKKRLKITQRRKERLRTRFMKESESEKDRPMPKRLGNGLTNLCRFGQFKAPRPEEEEEHKEDPFNPTQKKEKEKEEELDAESDKDMSVCSYCHKDLPTKQLANHESNCDMKKIPCEECGQRILMDIYDFHVEECRNTPRLFRRGGDNVRAIDILQSFFSMDPRLRGFENAGPLGFGGRPFGGNLMFGRPIGNRLETYEELLALDENKVKVGLTASELEKFKVREFVGKVETQERCNICLSEFGEGEKIRQLDCQHDFHVECIDTWLSGNITCPNCKKFMK